MFNREGSSFFLRKSQPLAVRSFLGGELWAVSGGAMTTYEVLYLMLMSANLVLNSVVALIALLSFISNNKRK